MAKKPTDKQLFKMKNEWLGQFYEEVKPRDFYRAVFPEGSFEREGHPLTGVLYFNKKGGKTSLII